MKTNEYAGTVFALKYRDQTLYVGKTVWVDQTKYKWSQSFPEADFEVLEQDIAQEHLEHRLEFWRSIFDDAPIKGRPTMKKIDRFLDQRGIASAPDR